MRPGLAEFFFFFLIRFGWGSLLRWVVWVVDRFIVLDLWWIVDGFVVDSGGFVVVILGQSRVRKENSVFRFVFLSSLI